jgi:hypothetical protein
MAIVVVDGSSLVDRVWSILDIRRQYVDLDVDRRICGCGVARCKCEATSKGCSDESIGHDVTSTTMLMQP